MAAYSKAILFYNEKSGQSNRKDLRQKIRAHFDEHNILLEIFVIPKPPEEISEIVSQAVSEGVDLFLAAGGDGTVSMVGNALLGSEIPLGILPLGTGNLLAQELKVPVKLEKALALITGNDHDVIKMDTFQLKERNYILNLSVGLTPKVMESTESKEKQQLGVIAYLLSFIQQILGLKLHRFTVDYDHHKEAYTASEILITNSQATGVEPLKWSDDVFVNDGYLDMLIIRAANIFDLLGLIISIFVHRQKYNPVIKYIQFKEYCQITTKTPTRTQADGDPVGQTPVKILVDPGSLKVIASKKGNYQKDKRSEP